MRTALLPLLALSLAGCNSSSDSDGAPPVFLVPDVQITEDNALDVAQAAVRAAFDLQRVAYIGAAFLKTPTPTPPGPTTSPGTLGSSLTVELTGPEGGIALFSWDDVNLDGIYSSGDVFTISLDDYGADGLVLNGAMQIDDVDLQGLVPGGQVWLLYANLKLLSLSVQIGSQVSTLNVTLPIRLERRIIVELFDGYLTQDLGFGPLELKRNNSFSRYEGEQSISFLFNGAVYSPAIDGLVRYDTKGALGGFPFFADPTYGIMNVRGANGSMLELEPGFFTLEIRVDEDGDEEFEATIASSFFELLP